VVSDFFGVAYRRAVVFTFPLVSFTSEWWHLLFFGIVYKRVVVIIFLLCSLQAYGDLYSSFVSFTS
jgi:hypothetical protein